MQAEAVLVKDLHSGTVMYEKRGRQRVPIASLAKLMTALCAESRLAPDEMVEIAAEDIRLPEQRSGLRVHDEASARDLLSVMLIGSANDAAQALARAAGGTVEDFVALMNERARELGMADTVFVNPVGLDEAGQFSTARDLSLLVEEFLRHPELVALTGKKEVTITSPDGRQKRRIGTTNKLLLRDPRVIGLKTGYTTEARGNLILLVEDSPEQVFYTIVLGSNNREQDSERIVSWVRENFTWTP